VKLRLLIAGIVLAALMLALLGVVLSAARRPATA